MPERTPSPPRPSKGLNVALWIVQALLFVTFAGGAVWKMATPIPDLAGKMPWMGQVSSSPGAAAAPPSRRAGEALSCRSARPRIGRERALASASSSR